MPSRRLSPPGTSVMARTAGGGGWGDPLDRDPARVRDDVLEDFVSVEAARDDYGVVIDAATRRSTGGDARTARGAAQ